LIAATGRDIQTGSGDAVRVRGDEVEGYGSNCQWSH
jgi:hypothetical protein